MSEQFNLKVEEFREYIQNDKLYDVIKGTSLEDKLFGEEYLLSLEEKRWYSTTEVAEWFGINDGQIRYYIKPFHEYIFNDDSPSSSTAFRLNVVSILKLRMIFLLKDEYRVKGLQQLLGLNGEGYIQEKTIKPVQKDIQIRSSLENEVIALKAMLEQILNTGIFEVRPGEEGSEIVLKEKFITQQLQHLLENGEDKKVLDELQEQVESVSKENAELKEKMAQTAEENRRMNESLKQIEQNRERVHEDVAIQIRDRQKVRSELRLIAIEEWNKQNKPSFLTKLLKSETIEIEKEKFIKDYIEQHFNESLKLVLAKNEVAATSEGEE